MILIEPEYDFCSDASIIKVIESDIDSYLSKEKNLTHAVTDFCITFMVPGAKV